MILEGERPARLLFDTCAMIYFFNGETIAVDALEAIDMASILISPISVWEIGVLGQKRRASTPVFLPDPSSWCRQALGLPTVVAAPFNAEIALASCNLLEPLHRDPADRFLIATALQLSVPIVTRDRLILAYASLGHVDAIAC